MSLIRQPTTPLPGANLALGRPYTLSQPPNYSYCTDAGDATQLTDGAFSQGYFWTDKATVGWQHNPRIDIVVDLGSIQPIGTIAINVAGGRRAAAAAGVELPDAWILVSADGKDFHEVRTFQGYRLPDLPDTYVRRYTASSLAVAGRYVAVVLLPNGPFAFLDEIEVLRDAQAAPPATPGTTLAGLGQAITERRGAMIAELGRERAVADRIAGVRANLAAAGVAAPAAPAGEDGPWLQANARLAAARFPGRPVIAWNRDPWKDHHLCSLPPAGTSSVASFSLVMGTTEYESAAVVLTNPGPDPLRITATLDALRGPAGIIPASDLTVRIDAIADCRDGVMRADALPLLDADGAVIEPGCTRQVWLSVRTTGQPAGTYRGELALGLPDGRLLLAVTAEVLPAKLPDRLPLAAVDWGYLSFTPCAADPDAAIRDRAAHRITTAVLNPPALPRFTVAADGGVTSSDFTAFDAAVARYRAAGFDRFIFFTFFGDMGGRRNALGSNVTAPSGLEVGSAPWTAALRAIVTTWLDHCRDLGLPPDQVAFYPWDEPLDAHLPLAGVLWKAIRQADPRARCFVTTPENSVAALEQISDDISTWCPHVYREKKFTAAHQDFYRRRQAAGQEYWIYNCQGPDKSFPPLAHYRRLAWQAWDLGATGVGVWNYADTGHGSFTSAWTDFDGTREDYSLVYDAATAPAGVSRRETQIPSRRWEAFRDGIEDHAYLWMLRQAAVGLRQRGDAAGAEAAEAVIREAATVVAADPASAAAFSQAHAHILRALAAIHLAP